MAVHGSVLMKKTTHTHFMTRRTILTLALLGVGSLMVPTIGRGGDFPKGSPKFETNHQKAMAEAKKTGKPVILVFSASWCPPCQANKAKVYPADAVKPYHDKFVWAYLDADDPANGSVAAKYKVNGIPHIQVIDAEGKALEKVIGGTSAEAFAKVLAKVAPKPAAQ
jgi:thioredoxin 1